MSIIFLKGTGKSFRHWTAVVSLLRRGLHAFWQPWVWAPILVVTLLVYKNAVVLPSKGEPAGLGSTSGSDSTAPTIASRFPATRR